MLLWKTKNRWEEPLRLPSSVLSAAETHEWSSSVVMPTLPRTPENYRRTMLKLAEAAEIVCPHQPDADETIHFDGADEFFN